MSGPRRPTTQRLAAPLRASLTEPLFPTVSHLKQSALLRCVVADKRKAGGKLAITAQDDSYNSQLSISFLNGKYFLIV